MNKNIESAPIKPFNCLTNLEIQDFTFEKPREEFEGVLNLELAIIQKEMREYVLAEYERRNGTPPEVQ